MPPRHASPPSSSSAQASIDDVAAAVATHLVDPEDPENNNWLLLAAKVYCATGQHMSPLELESLLLKYIRSCGGFQAALSNAQSMLASSTMSKDVTFRGDLPFRESADAHRSNAPMNGSCTAASASAMKKEDVDEMKLAAMSRRGGGAESTRLQYHLSGGREAKQREMSSEHLLDILQMFRAVEGYDVFEEPVGPRVVNTVMSTNNYATVVRKPVSISSIRTSIYDGQLRTPQQLEQAVWTIAANCVFFNVPEGQYPGLARRFAAACSAIINRESGLR